MQILRVKAVMCLPTGLWRPVLPVAAELDFLLLHGVCMVFGVLDSRCAQGECAPHQPVSD
jgi:hypothetical protein